MVKNKVIKRTYNDNALLMDGGDDDDDFDPRKYDNDFNDTSDKMKPTGMKYKMRNATNDNEAVLLRYVYEIAKDL